MSRSYPVIDQKLLIFKSNWKYLIVLDACRFDYFSEIYEEYPRLRTGKLKKALSCGTNTTDWLNCTFRGKELNDVIYISSNPYVNSKGIKVRHFNPRSLKFYKIIDVWDFGWDSSLGTVHPKEVNKFAHIMAKLYRDKRLIVHYMQPHYPYIGLSLNNIPKPSKGDALLFEREVKFHQRIRGFIRWKLVSLLGYELGRKVAIKLVGPPNPGHDVLEIISNNLGRESLINAYKENLRIVLKYVDKLVSKLKGKMVITADHGELLGEHGLYGHPTWIMVPELLEVPWLEIG